MCKAEVPEGMEMEVGREVVMAGGLREEGVKEIGREVGDWGGRGKGGV